MANKNKSPKAAKAVLKPVKITPASKPRTKGEFYTTISGATGVPRKQIASIFETLGKVISADLSKSGPGVLNLGGMMKGINPFTKEEVMFKAKPARNVIKIRPLKALKSMV